MYRRCIGFGNDRSGSQENGGGKEHIQEKMRGVCTENHFDYLFVGVNRFQGNRIVVVAQNKVGMSGFCMIVGGFEIVGKSQNLKMKIHFQNEGIWSYLGSCLGCWGWSLHTVCEVSAHSWNYKGEKEYKDVDIGSQNDHTRLLHDTIA